MPSGNKPLPEPMLTQISVSPYGVTRPQWVKTHKRRYHISSSQVSYCCILEEIDTTIHDDVIKWKHLPHYWPFVWRIHRSPVNSLNKGHWRGGLMFSLICAWINGWVNNGEAGDLRHHHAHYDVTVMNRLAMQFCDRTLPWDIDGALRNCL